MANSPGQAYACSFFELRGQRAQLSMCRDGRYKLIRHGRRLYWGEDLLFDLHEDPDESTDVGAEHRDKLRELSRALERVETGLRPRFAGRTELIEAPG